jgi:hypothetical protein
MLQIRLNTMILILNMTEIKDENDFVHACGSDTDSIGDALGEHCIVDTSTLIETEEVENVEVETAEVVEVEDVEISKPEEVDPENISDTDSIDTFITGTEVYIIMVDGVPEFYSNDMETAVRNMWKKAREIQSEFDPVPYKTVIAEMSDHEVNVMGYQAFVVMSYSKVISRLKILKILEME